MDFNTLKYIVEIVETGSISKAANSLFISQPTLSNLVSSFEKEVGKEIFIRGNRGILLTCYGNEVYTYAKALINQYEIVERKLTNKVNENTVKISSFGSPVINEIFVQTVKEYNEENYEFDLYECGTEECISRVSNRESDIGIIIYSPNQLKKLAQHLHYKNLELRNLFNGWMKIHISKKWNLSRKDVIEKKDLEGLIHVKKSYLYQGLFNLEYEAKLLGIPDNTKNIITNGKNIYIDTLNNIPSFGVVVDWNCKKDINGDLKRIPFENKEMILNCGFIKRKDETLKEELNYFIQGLINAYGDN